MSMLKENLEKIRSVFNKRGVAYVDPYSTTVGELYRGKAGKHTGHYWIGDNFYFGRAKGSQSVCGRFKPHYAKLNARFDWLFAAKNEITPEAAAEKIHKSSAHWKIGKGWKELIKNKLYEDCSEFPEYFRKTDRGYEAGDFTFTATPLYDIDTMGVQVWNLDHLTPEQITDLETAIIDAIDPYANEETFKKRKKKKNPKMTEFSRKIDLLINS